MWRDLVVFRWQLTVWQLGTVIRPTWGFSGEIQLQLILEDPSDIIRKVQAFIRCDDIEPGLTIEELKEVEQKYGFRFPPDVRDFLQVGLPLGCGWHDWRRLGKVTVSDDTEDTEDTVSQIQKLHCIPWRARYSKDRQWDENESLAKAQDLASRVYPLIPLCQHRCIPSVPHECGLPILSMHGCYDNLCHSRNFWTWLEEAAHIPAGVIPQSWKDKTVPVYEVPFWQHWYDIWVAQKMLPVRKTDKSPSHYSTLHRTVWPPVVAPLFSFFCMSSEV